MVGAARNNNIINNNNNNNNNNFATKQLRTIAVQFGGDGLGGRQQSNTYIRVVQQ